jgi:hypothetical protein
LWYIQSMTLLLLGGDVDSVSSGPSYSGDEDGSGEATLSDTRRRGLNDADMLLSDAIHNLEELFPEEGDDDAGEASVLRRTSDAAVDATSRAKASAAALCRPCFTRAILATIMNKRQEAGGSISGDASLDSIAAMLSVEITSVEGVLVNSNTRRLGTSIGIVTTYTIRVASGSSGLVTVVSDALDGLANPTANTTTLDSFTTQLAAEYEVEAVTGDGVDGDFQFTALSATGPLLAEDAPTEAPTKAPMAPELVYTTPITPVEKKTSPAGAIAGGVVGILLLLAVVVLTRKISRRIASKAQATVGVEEMEEKKSEAEQTNQEDGKKDIGGSWATKRKWANRAGHSKIYMVGDKSDDDDENGEDERPPTGMRKAFVEMKEAVAAPEKSAFVEMKEAVSAAEEITAAKNVLAPEMDAEPISDAGYGADESQVESSSDEDDEDEPFGLQATSKKSSVKLHSILSPVARTKIQAVARITPTKTKKMQTTPMVVRSPSPEKKPGVVRQVNSPIEVKEKPMSEFVPSAVSEVSEFMREIMAQTTKAVNKASAVAVDAAMAAAMSAAAAEMVLVELQEEVRRKDERKAQKEAIVRQHRQQLEEVSQQTKSSAGFRAAYMAKQMQRRQQAQANYAPLPSAVFVANAGAVRVGREAAMAAAVAAATASVTATLAMAGSSVIPTASKRKAREEKALKEKLNSPDYQKARNDSTKRKQSDDGTMALFGGFLESSSDEEEGEEKKEEEQYITTPRPATGDVAGDRNGNMGLGGMSGMNMSGMDNTRSPGFGGSPWQAHNSPAQPRRPQFMQDKRMGLMGVQLTPLVNRPHTPDDKGKELRPGSAKKLSRERSGLAPPQGALWNTRPISRERNSPYQFPGERQGIPTGVISGPRATWQMAVARAMGSEEKKEEEKDESFK